MCWKQQFPYYRYTSISIWIEGKKHITVVNIFECLCLCSYTHFLRRINYILYIFVIINQSKKYNMYIILKFRFTWLIFIWPLVAINTINIVKDLLTFCLLEQLHFYIIYLPRYEWIQYFIWANYNVGKSEIKIVIKSYITVSYYVTYLNLASINNTTQKFLS